MNPYLNWNSQYYSAAFSQLYMFYQNMDFPLKNLRVVQELSALRKAEGTVVLALKGIRSPSYSQLTGLASEILEAFRAETLIIAVETDMAKALGQILALRLGTAAKILCIDRVHLEEESYLDVGAPVGPALPVVVKTLILSR